MAIRQWRFRSSLLVSAQAWLEFKNLVSQKKYSLTPSESVKFYEQVQDSQTARMLPERTNEGKNVKQA